MTPKTHTMKLQEAIIELIEHPSNTNNTGLSLCPQLGWRLTFNDYDRGDGEVMVLAKESLIEWADGQAWDELQYYLADKWVLDNLSEWLRREENYIELMEAAL